MPRKGVDAWARGGGRLHESSLSQPLGPDARSRKETDVEKVRTRTATVLLVVGVLWVKPALAEDCLCCAHCQGGNSTPTICVSGDCFWYETQKCSCYTRRGETLCRQQIDTILCPRSTFSPNPWAPDENHVSAHALTNPAE